MRAVLLALALVLPAYANAQTLPPSNDGVSRLMRDLERVIATSDQRAYASLVTPGANTSNEFHEEWLEPGVTRAVVQERLRAEVPQVAKGLAYDVYVDVLTEHGRNARVGTFLVRVFRTSAEATDWRIARLNVLTTVRGLYRLSVNPDKEYRIANLALSAEDFELRVPNGVGFVAETDAGVTGIVILGRGEMTFSPTPAAEKGQVRIYSGSDAHTSRFNWVYLRAHPAEFDRRLDVSTFHVRDVDPRDLRRAEAVFQENLPRSFGIELADLSRDRWSVIPKFGDFVAEIDTDRAHLTYMRSMNEAEDIRFFDRTRNRTIAIYPVEGETSHARTILQRRRPDRFRYRQLRHRRELRSTTGVDRRKGDTARHRAPGSDFLAGADAGRAADGAFRHKRAPRLPDGAARQRTGRHHHQSARAAQA